MKILVFSDVHLDAVTAGVSRHEEIRELMDRVTQRAIHPPGGAVDLVMFLGDLCDPDSGIDCLRASSVAIAMERQLEKAGVKTLWVAGNHDVGEDGRGTTTLDPLKASGARVFSQPGGWGDNDELGRRTEICVLPFTERSDPYDPAEVVQRFFERRHFDAHCVIVAGHLNLEGIGPGSETEDMPRGRDVFFPIREVQDAARNFGAKVIAVCGHYHRQQVYEGVHIPGALARLRRDEESNDPGYLIIDTEAP